jgi:hypothetical protein
MVVSPTTRIDEVVSGTEDAIHRLILGFLLLSLAACGGANHSPPPSESTVGKASPAAAGERSGSPVLQRQLVRTAELHISVPNTQEAVDSIRSTVMSSGGYVQSLDARQDQGLVHFQLSVRVPNDTLESTIATIKGLADTVHREVLQTEDVTDRLVDLDARLRTLNATEEELRSLLSESRSRQQDVDAIMAVYRQLTEIRSEIERLQAQVETLEKRVALSTLDLQVLPSAAARPVVAQGWRPLETARSSLAMLVRGLQGLVDLAIVLALVVLPLLAAVALPVWLVVRAIRSRKRRAGRPDGAERVGS